MRELRNVVERALILEDRDLITPEYLPRDLAESAGLSLALPTRNEGRAASEKGFVLPHGGVSLDELETSLVRQAVERSGGNQTRAAELLGISRDQLRYRLKKLEDTAGAAATEAASQ